MVAKLNKVLFFCILFLIQQFTFSQSDAVATDYSDYKDPKQFEKYAKRRNVISAWQIHQFKTGALVVRLKTNKKLIDALTQQGNTKLAQQKLLEQYAINKNTMIAFIDNFKFCKLYFIYSNSSDSLLNGHRTNIFLDTNMTVNPTIEMKEKFYLLADKDNVYNSSIGFIKEDSAKYETEKGNIGNEMAFVLKNKFGHQLKKPFPYFIKNYLSVKSISGSEFDFPINISQNTNGSTFVYFVVNKYFLSEQQEIKDRKRKAVVLRETETTKIVVVKKQFLYEQLAVSIQQLDENLRQYFQLSPLPSQGELNDPLIKPFLY